VFVACWVGSGLSDELITSSEESYRVYVSQQWGGQDPKWAVTKQEKNLRTS